MPKISILLYSFLLTSGGSVIYSATVKYTFEASYISGSPDGVLKTNILAINNQFPGPTIEAFVNDIIEVTLMNKIQDFQNVTLHWHGITQKGSLFDDGTSMISQCPLPFGSFQVYRFQVTQPGTFWYHSHVNSQYTEGLIGPIIVHSPSEHYQYNGELTLILNDWYHRSAHENENWYLSPPSAGLSPYPDSSLINGYGRYPCDFASLQNRSCSTANQLRPVYTIQQNATYRVRIINAAALTFFHFSIDNHTLETIEADGIDVAEAVSVNVASIAPGQRYSFLVHPQIPISPENNRFIIRSTVRKDILQEQLSPNPRFENINKYPQALFNETTAVLQIVDRDLSSSPHKVETSFEQLSFEEVIPPPSDDQDEIVYLNEMDLRPLDGIPAPDYYDQEYILNSIAVLDENGVRRESFNDTPFKLPQDKPLLFSLLEDGKLPEGAFPLEVRNGSVVQIVLNSAATHPFHLHGHHFWVVGIGQPGDGSYNPSRHTLNLNGVKRDTVVSNSWAVIRFIADNPGVWTLHCHFDWHNLAGMAVTIVEAPEIVREEVTPTEEALRICRLHNR